LPSDVQLILFPIRRGKLFMDSRQIRLPDQERDEEHTVVEPLLVKAKTAAAMCGKSLRTWRTWDAAGWIPRPVRIGRSTLWRVDELREWIVAGCPRRAEWEARK
jgi:predicted DNA-binding transcriptional regulator AlpA